MTEDADDRNDESLLACLGVGADEERVYRMMLRRPELNMSDLAAELALEEADVLEAQGGLRSLALVRSSWEEPDRVTAIKPNLALSALISTHQQEILEQQKRVEEGKVAIARIMAESGALVQSAKGPSLEYLRGLDDARAGIEELSRDINVEVQALIPKASLSVEGMEASKSLDEEVLSRGVAMRTVYLDSVRNHPPTQHYAHWLRERGGEVRTAPTLPMRIILIDRKIAILPIDAADSSKGALLVREPSILAALLTLFSKIWDSARPLGTADERDSAGLSAQERELLKLLGDGMTDEVAARHLGLSLRSVRRLMSDIMSRLDARSRFAAGARASERGWL